MATRSVTLTGGKALAVLAVLAAFMVLRYIIRHVPLDAAGREAVRSWVVIEVKRSALTSSGLATSADSGRAVASLSDSAIVIRSITIRGTNEDMVARVEVQMAEGTLPAVHSVQYVRLKHSFVTGWQVTGESSAFGYFAKLW